MSVMLRTLCMSLCLYFFSHTAVSAPLTKEEVPTPLQPWVDWVLQGEDHRNCPFLYNNGDTHRCSWPSQLDLSLNEQSGGFTINWHIYNKSRITLPGDQKNWPSNVTINGTPISVTAFKGSPAITLPAGEYQVKGNFEWNKLPDSLTIPANTGLISLKVNHRQINFPNLKGTKLWIKQRQNAVKGQKGEQVKVEVYRRIIDEIPMQMLTKVQLQVSGKQREVIIGNPLVANAIPLQLNSQLPARIEPDGSLRVQLRPGRWTIDVHSRFPADVTSLSMPEQAAPWPTEEVWVFDAQTNLRLVEVTDVLSIDPRQTQMPSTWQKLPAFRLSANDTMNLKVIRRGDPEPEPNSLQLSRNLWLDQSGAGFTITDKINGRMTQGWRLEASEALKLGRVTLDNSPQFITQVNKKEGVEVRRGVVSLNADSRYEGDVTSFNAVGWDHDFQSVSTTLHLPPGWKLFSAKGVDRVPNTWLQRWTLLDLFLVLITSLAISNLWNWKTGLLSLITLVLLWHEPGAPRLIWLNIIAAIALLRVLPKGNFRFVINSYKNLALLALVLMSIPYMIDAVRIGLYPQVERPWHSVAGNSNELDDHSPMALEEAELSGVESVRPAMSAAKARVSKKILGDSSRYQSNSNQSKFPVRYDAKTNVQTGPGLPNWSWNSAQLNWNGPVEKGQQVGLILLSPQVNLSLNILRVLLLVALAYFIIRTGKTGRGLNLNIKPHGAAAAILLLPAFLLGSPQEAHAEMPSQQMLQELKTRLLEKADCLPDCAYASKMNLQLSPRNISISLEVHSNDNVIVPLPSMADKWAITLLQLNNELPKDISKDKNGQLWIQLSPGIHQVYLQALLPEHNTIDLTLPLKPSSVTLNSAGWDVAGIHESGFPERQLKLTRIQDKTGSNQKTLEATTLPSFVQIHRTLRLGLDWRVETSIVRASPKDSAVVIKVPLLEGESVLSDGFRVKDGHVLVNMSANTSSIQWESSLKPSESIKLTAPSTQDWTEYWYADVSPIWHLETEGLAVVHHQNPEGRWLPEWRPWSDESVTLNISRPQGIEGQTLTIDSSVLNVSPGERATDVSLYLSLRSSQGGQHTIKLPEKARLQSVLINGRSQPIRQSGADGRDVTLPIHPGKQSINLQWRMPEGISKLHKTPQVDLGVPSVNNKINLNLGRDRWVLSTGGPQWGPAVLFWGILAVILLIAVGLGQLKMTPLNTVQWLLLSIGLSQAPVYAAVMVVIWLLALDKRENLKRELSTLQFNFMQIGLVLLTFFALSTLFSAIQQGLLGSPNMQIAGNASSATALHWYQDRVENLIPQAWTVSVPLFIYRVLMLLWSLWLAFSLLKWLRWGWESFSKDGYWQTFTFRSKKANKKSTEIAGADKTKD